MSFYIPLTKACARACNLCQRKLHLTLSLADCWEISLDLEWKLCTVL